jgi:hypothetical protein
MPARLAAAQTASSPSPAPRGSGTSPGGGGEFADLDPVTDQDQRAAGGALTGDPQQPVDPRAVLVQGPGPPPPSADSCVRRTRGGPRGSARGGAGVAGQLDQEEIAAGHQGDTEPVHQLGVRQLLAPRIGTSWHTVSLRAPSTRAPSTRARRSGPRRRRRRRRAPAEAFGDDPVRREESRPGCAAFPAKARNPRGRVIGPTPPGGGAHAPRHRSPSGWAPPPLHATPHSPPHSPGLAERMQVHRPKPARPRSGNRRATGGRFTGPSGVDSAFADASAGRCRPGARTHAHRARRCRGRRPGRDPARGGAVTGPADGPRGASARFGWVRGRPGPHRPDAVAERPRGP